MDVEATDMSSERALGLCLGDERVDFSRERGREGRERGGREGTESDWAIIA